MFSNISWQTYWTALVAITIAYYLVIYLVYFKKALQLSSSQQAFNSSSIEESQPVLFEAENTGTKGLMNYNEDHVIEACMDELNAFFENQKKAKAIKTELMFGLHMILQKYPSLRNSDYKESFTNVIATQSENICSIHLNAEELKGVWFGL